MHWLNEELAGFGLGPLRRKHLPWVLAAGVVVAAVALLTAWAWRRDQRALEEQKRELVARLAGRSLPVLGASEEEIEALCSWRLLSESHGANYKVLSLDMGIEWGIFGRVYYVQMKPELACSYLPKKGPTVYGVALGMGIDEARVALVKQGFRQGGDSHPEAPGELIQWYSIHGTSTDLLPDLQVEVYSRDGHVTSIYAGNPHVQFDPHALPR
jgi:hypothetical protein